MKRKVTLALLALCLVLCMFGTVACQPQQPATYKITVA